MQNTIKTVLKGAAMGIAEVIPGVSGGTIAFITGIYERLLNAIKSINPGLIQVFKGGGIKGVLKAIDAFFLIKLFAGMIIGFLVGLKIIVKLLESHPVLIWSFFFGLIIASIPLVAKQVKKWGGLEIGMLVFGAALVYWVTIAGPSQGSENLLFVFLAGVIGVSALMLPGLSGRFTHHPFGPETTMLLVFGLGLLVGLFSFARLLSYTFKKYPNPTLALLTGFLIGSLNKVWPWQKVLETRTNSKGIEVVQFSESVLPNTFARLQENFLYGTNPHILQAVMVIAIAIVLVYLLDRFSPESDS